MKLARPGRCTKTGRTTFLTRSASLHFSIVVVAAAARG
jgi:hypothetical protein